MVGVFGIGKSNLGYESSEAACQFCNKEKSVMLLFRGTYLSAFFIPIFPIYKKVVAICGNCSVVLDRNAFTGPVLKTYMITKAKHKHKVGHYTGLLVIASIVSLTMLTSVYSLFQAGGKKDEEKLLLTNPKKGDIYDIELGRKSYTTMRVDSTFKDSLILIQNDFETTKAWKLSDAKFKDLDNFNSEPIYMSKKDIIKMESDNKLRSVERPK